MKQEKRRLKDCSFYAGECGIGYFNEYKIQTKKWYGWKTIASFYSLYEALNVFKTGVSNKEDFLAHIRTFGMHSGRPVSKNRILLEEDKGKLIGALSLVTSSQ